jgi:hypothetical protein
MTPNDRRLWIDVTAARYLEAVEREDFAAQDELWLLAAADPDLEAAFHEIHALIIEEEQERTTAAVAAAVEQHLPAARVVQPAAGPVTFADVADELFRAPPGGVPTDGWRLNDALRSSDEPLPRELGLTALIEFAEKKFGVAPREYWKAFREAALTVRMRANTLAADYQLAARRGPKPEDPT